MNRIAIHLLSLAVLSLLAACELPPPVSAGDTDDPDRPWIPVTDADRLHDVGPSEWPPDPDAGIPPEWDGEGPRPDDPRPSAVIPTVFEDAVLSADGRYLVQQVADAGGRRCVVVANVETGGVERSERYCDMRWIAPDPRGARVWLLGAEGRGAVLLNLADLSAAQVFSTEDTYTTLEPSPTGSTVVLSNRPTDRWAESQYEWNTYDMDMRHLAVLWLEMNVVHEQSFPFAIRDVAFSPVDAAVLVAMSWWKEDGQPEAQVHFMNPASGIVEDRVTFPNCADELAIQPDGEVAILSPRQCFVHPISLAPEEPEPEEWPTPEDDWDDWEDWPEADPASVIDLRERSFRGNLPGFGPVAISPDGATAVAFSRQETLMRQWNVFQRARVGLVVIRLADLYWQIVEYGPSEPDFFFAPDGAQLLLHHRADGEDRVVRMATDTLALAELAGPPATFDRRAATPDGDTVYSVFDGRLRRIDASGGDVVTSVPLAYEIAQVFARPQGDWIVVTERGASRAHVLTADDAAAVRSLSL